MINFNIDYNNCYQADEQVVSKALEDNAEERTALRNKPGSVSRTIFIANSLLKVSDCLVPPPLLIRFGILTTSRQWPSISTNVMQYASLVQFRNDLSEHASIVCVLHNQGAK